MASVPIFTVYGDETPFYLELFPAGDGQATLRIDGDFAGRQVEEEIPREALDRLASEEPFDYQDILGLRLSTDGKVVTGLIGVGSGNEGFQLERTTLRAAIESI